MRLIAGPPIHIGPGDGGDDLTDQPADADEELVAFVNAEQLRLIGLVALYVGDRWTAEELVQEAFVRLCQHWARVRRMADRRAWLNRVAINLARSWFRRRYAERRANRRHHQFAAGNLDRKGLEYATVDAIREAVAALPQRQRTALILRFYEDMPVADVAEFMGCAQGTVKSLTHRAVSNLRDGGRLTGFQDAPDDA